jgi:acyl dehydratase
MDANDKKSNSIAAGSGDGKINDETLAVARKMIGVRLRPEGPYMQDVTPDTIRNFCNGVGDTNPLYRDLEHGRNSQYGAVLASPMFPMAYGWIGRTRWGLPGVHGFFGGNDWEFFRHLRPGDRVTAIERVVAVEDKESRFSGRLAIQLSEGEFYNQRDELIARVLGWCTRHERKAAREKGKYRDIERYEYSDDEIEHINSTILNEENTVRGREIRYWEDVNVGDDLPPVARGPLSNMDTLGFLVGCGRGHTGGQILKTAVKHPGHFIRSEESGGRMEHTINIHHRESMAKKAGIPGVLDYGAQRCAWLSIPVTNWMGDAAVLKRMRTELRLPNAMGDTTWCKGKVSAKYVKDGFALVDISVWAENQRGDVTAPNCCATVILPSKVITTKNAQNGTGIDLGFGIYGKEK